MYRKLICERCYNMNPGTDPVIYSNDEERCPDCKAFLVQYTGMRRKNMTVTAKAANSANNPISSSVQSSQTVASNIVTGNSNQIQNSINTVSAKKTSNNSNSSNSKPVNPSQSTVGKKATATSANVTIRNSTIVKPNINQPVAPIKTSNSNNGVSHKSVVDEIFDKHNLIGLNDAKNTLSKYYSVWDTENFKKALLGKTKENMTISKLSFLVAGEELTGKTELSYIISEMLNKAGIRSNLLPEIIRLKDFEGVLGDDKSLKDFLKDYKGKTVLVEESLDEAFLDKDGNISVDANKVVDIVHAIKRINGEMTIIFELTPILMSELALSNTKINDCFYQVEIGKYSDDELLELSKKRIVEEQKYVLSNDAIEQLRNRIKTTSFDGYSQGRFIVDVLQGAIEKLEDRIKNDSSLSKDARFTFIKSDIQYKVFDKDKAEEILEEIDARSGQKQIKEYAHKIYDSAVRNEKRIQNGKAPLKTDQPNFILEGDAGVGKTTSCCMLAKLLKECGVLAFDEPLIVSIAELQASGIGATPEKVKQVFAKAKGKLLVIDEAYTLAPSGNGISGNYGQEVVDTITNELGKPGKDIVVVLIGYTDSIEPVLQMNKGMKRRFPHKIVLEGYSIDMMTNIFIDHLQKNNFSLEDGAREKVYRLLDMRSKSENFGNAGGVISICEDLMNSSSSDNDMITNFDLDNAINASTGSNVDAVLEELSSLIGIDNVKALVNSMVDGLNGRARQKAAGINIKDPSSYNMIFAGPPGTGKTSISRLIAKLFSELGILKYSDKIKEIDGKDLIAGYVGQTEEKVTKVISEATGGVLYIDEVYQMDNGTEFGKSAINALCKGLDGRGNELIVIISGYSNEVDEFLSNNPGLRSRFPTYVEFYPYTEDELIRIFEQFIAKSDIRCDESYEFKDKLRGWIEANMNDPEFGNGRSMRNLAEKCISNLQARIGRDPGFPIEQMRVIKAQDIPDVA